MTRQLFPALALALIACQAPTGPNTEPQEPTKGYYCYTEGSKSVVVYGVNCGGLACPMETLDGKPIAVRSQNLTKEIEQCQ